MAASSEVESKGRGGGGGGGIFLKLMIQACEMLSHYERLGLECGDRPAWAVGSRFL